MKNNHHQIFAQHYSSAGTLFSPAGPSRCGWDVRHQQLPLRFAGVPPQAPRPSLYGGGAYCHTFSTSACMWSWKPP